MTTSSCDCLRGLEPELAAAMTSPTALKYGGDARYSQNLRLRVCSIDPELKGAGCTEKEPCQMTEVPPDIPRLTKTDEGLRGFKAQGMQERQVPGGAHPPGVLVDLDDLRGVPDLLHQEGHVLDLRQSARGRR